MQARSVGGASSASAAAKVNILINGTFHTNQAAPASIADDVYGHDQWYALTQTGAIAPSTLTDVENTTPFMARLTQSQATAQRFGYAQIIEGRRCKAYRGQTVTFRFGRTRLSSSANVRIAVLEWTGTEDAVTSDVVLDWTSTAYTAGNFFLAANLTVSGVVQQALTANTLTDGSSVTVTLGSTFNNLIIFVWTETVAAQNVMLDLAKAQLETGSTAGAYDARDYTVDLELCKWYFERISKSTQLDTYCLYQSITTGTARAFLTYLQKRVAPTISNATYSNFYNTRADNTPDALTGAISWANITTTSAIGSLTCNPALTVGAVGRLMHGANTSYIDIDSRL